MDGATHSATDSTDTQQDGNPGVPVSYETVEHAGAQKRFLGPRASWPGAL